MNDSTPTIHGDRTCLKCRGICHDGSYRNTFPQKYGGRSHYFCRRACVKYYYREQIAKQFRKLKLYRQDEYFASDEFEGYFQDHLTNNYERVDIITRQDRINAGL